MGGIALHAINLAQDGTLLRSTLASLVPGLHEPCSENKPDHTGRPESMYLTEVVTVL